MTRRTSAIVALGWGGAAAAIVGLVLLLAGDRRRALVLFAFSLLAHGVRVLVDDGR